MSYWSSSSGRSLLNPSWHQSTHGHGTIMANSIVRVNPWVSLYAMRIQDEVKFGPRNNSIRIHANSAALAIEDANILKADIISISWTIRNLVIKDGRAVRAHDAEALESLKKAIDNAKTAGILIFCSASDDIQTRGIDTLPYGQAREYAFRIGRRMRTGGATGRPSTRGQSTGSSPAIRWPTISIHVLCERAS